MGKRGGYAGILGQPKAQRGDGCAAAVLREPVHGHPLHGSGSIVLLTHCGSFNGFCHRSLGCAEAAGRTSAFSPSQDALHPAGFLLVKECLKPLFISLSTWQPSPSASSRKRTAPI